MEENKTVTLPFYARFCMVLLSVVLILFLMHVAKAIIIPLFFSLLITFLLLPVSKWLERKRVPKGLAAILPILGFIVFVVLLFVFLGSQLTAFSRDLPEFGTRLQAWMEQLQAMISRRYHVDYSQQIAYLNKASAGIAGSASMVAQNFFMAATGFIIWTIFVFIFTFFILTHRGLLRRFIIELFGARYKGRVNEVMQETRVLANSYVLGLMIEMVIVAVLNCTVFLLFGIKYALLLGILAAILNIIPYLGIYTATAIAAVITLSNSTPTHALQVIIILVVIHFIDANILLPRIVGGRVKMNPLITIVAVISGSILWGIPGMFLFIPLVAILKIIFERVEGLKPWALLMGTDDDDNKPTGFKKDIKKLVD
jgi:AI-2 transport protein TqsA